MNSLIFGGQLTVETVPASLESPFMPSLIEIGLLVLEKKILKNFQCIFTLLLLPYIRFYSRVTNFAKIG
jgi:hypothetical protein